MSIVTSSLKRSENARGETCAVRFHQALSNEIQDGVRTIQIAADRLRQPLPDRPGYWLFWDGTGILARNARQQRLLARPILNREANKMCARSILARGGRIRCLKWKPIPPGYVPPPVKLPTVDATKADISPAERRIAGRLARRVMRKGAFAELDFNTAMYHMAQRTTDELLVYTSQPLRPTICSGAREMVAFYRQKLSALSDKQLASVQLRDETRRAAQATTDAAVIAVSKNTLRKYAAQRTTLTPATSPRGSDTHLREQIARLLPHVLEESELVAAEAVEAPLAALLVLRELLTDQHFSEMLGDRRHRLRKALRNIEFAAYAADNALGFASLHQAFEDVFTSILQAHTKHCTCLPR